MKKLLFIPILSVLLITGCAGLNTGTVSEGVKTVVEDITNRDPEDIGQLICDGSIIAEREEQALLIFGSLDTYLKSFVGRELLVREAVESAADLLRKTGVPADQKVVKKVQAGVRLALKSRYVLLPTDPADKLAWFQKAVRAAADCLKE